MQQPSRYQWRQWAQPNWAQAPPQQMGPAGDQYHWQRPQGPSGMPGVVPMAVQSQAQNAPPSLPQNVASSQPPNAAGAGIIFVYNLNTAR